MNAPHLFSMRSPRRGSMFSRSLAYYPTDNTNPSVKYVTLLSPDPLVSLGCAKLSCYLFAARVSNCRIWRRKVSIVSGCSTGGMACDEVSDKWIRYAWMWSGATFLHRYQGLANAELPHTNLEHTAEWHPQEPRSCGSRTHRTPGRHSRRKNMPR